MTTPNLTTQETTEALIARNRARYEELKAAAAGIAPTVLPSPTPLDGAPISAADIRHREVIPGGWYWTKLIRRGEGLRLLNTSGTEGVSLFAWNAADTAERYNSADTVKLQWTSELRKGRVLFSDMGRVMLSIIEDTSGAHDTIVGGSTPASNARNFGDASLRSTRENLLLAAAKHGLGARDLAPVITFFAPVGVTGETAAWREGATVRAGEFVDLRAEMDLIVAVSNCPHPLSPATTFAPGEIEAIVFRLAEPGADDLSRTATQEARRGFENNDLYFQA
jgi:urea carboxylase-associated protein 2